MTKSISDTFNEAWSAAESSTDGDSSGSDTSESFDTGMAGAEVSYGDEISFGETDSDDGESETADDDQSTDAHTEGVDNGQFDWKQFGDRKVVLKVQGEEIEVPLAEALNGYMRQSDYTKKTQAHADQVKLAEWAQQLREAIQADPAGTIKYLQDQYGITDQKIVDDDYDPELKPLFEMVSSQQREMAALQAQIQRFEADRVLNEVRSELRSVQTEFPDLDPNVVLPLAAQRGLGIRDAYLLSESEKIIGSRRDAERVAAEASRRAEIEAEKRRNASRTTKSAGVAGQSKVQPPKFESFAELLQWNLDRAEASV